MLRLARSTIGLFALGAIAACHRPNGPLISGDAVANTPHARSVDALWMIALPPVTVVAPDVENATTRTVEPRRGDDTVRVSLREWKIGMSGAPVAAGIVTFRVHNDGRLPHALEIEARGVEHAMPPIAPGADTVVAFRLRQGKYEAYCPVGEGSAHPHKSMGMLATLVVSADSGHARGAAAGY
jgi:hypothetical protein